MKSFVYFVKAGPFLKIGWSYRPAARFGRSQTYCPYDLETVLVISGDSDTESLFHWRFSDLYERGEWFRIEGELADFVTRYADRCLSVGEEKSLIHETELEVHRRYPAAGDFERAKRSAQFLYHARRRQTLFSESDYCPLAEAVPA